MRHHHPSCPQRFDHTQPCAGCPLPTRSSCLLPLGVTLTLWGLIGTALLHLVAR